LRRPAGPGKKHTTRSRQPLIAVGTAGNSPLMRSIIDMCGRASFVPRIAHTVWQVSPAVSLAAAGLGVAVVPHSASELQITDAVFRPLAVEDQSILEFAFRSNEGAPATLALIREARRYASERTFRDLRPADCEIYAAE
jgi:DNA-binding transcriptional LysR family regulator